jgi:hypothetical protein
MIAIRQKLAIPFKYGICLGQPDGSNVFLADLPSRLVQ